MIYLEKLKKIKPKSDIAVRRPMLKKGTSAVICILFFLALSALLLQSAFDTDKTVSESENRTLAQMPKITWQAITDGSFMQDFESYYTDAFPLRERFLSVNQKLSAIFSGIRSSDDVVLVEKGDKEDFAGQDIDYAE